MRSSCRLVCPPRSRLMPVAAAAPIALLAGRPVTAALGPVSGGPVPGDTALAILGGHVAAGGPAAAISATGAGGGRTPMTPRIL